MNARGDFMNVARLMAIAGAIATAVNLGGCVSEAERQQQLALEEAARVADATCRQNAKTHLASAKCDTAAVMRDPALSTGSNADLVNLATAQLENIADRQDRGLITEQEAKVETASAISQVTSSAQQRQLAAAQRLAALQAAEPAPQPIYVAPTPRSVHCTTMTTGMMSNTNCF